MRNIIDNKSKKSFFRRFWWLSLIIGLFIIIVAAMIRINARDDKSGQFSSITPLGNLNPSSHTFPTDHIYIEVADPQHPEKNTIANAKSLIAPADMWILEPV